MEDNRRDEEYKRNIGKLYALAQGLEEELRSGNCQLVIDEAKKAANGMAVGIKKLCRKKEIINFGIELATGAVVGTLGYLFADDIGLRHVAQHIVDVAEQSHEVLPHYTADVISKFMGAAGGFLVGGWFLSRFITSYFSSALKPYEDDLLYCKRRFDVIAQWAETKMRTKMRESQKQT